MAITVECSNCGRRYNVDESIAGRTVKCRQCGNPIHVPRSGEEGLEPEVDLSALSALAESAITDEQAAMARMPRVESNPGSEMAVEGEEPVAFGRQNFRFTFPYARQVDQYLPMILVIIGLFFSGYLIVDNDHSNSTWMVILRFLVVFLTYTCVACPLALVGLKKASRAMRYQLPRKPKWRTFAVFMPALALAMLFWFIGQSLVGLILGVVSGLIVAAGLIWLLFRLQPHEIVTSALYGALGFVGGTILAGGILFGMNLLTLQVLTSMKKAQTLPGSPFGELFTWTEPGIAPVPPTVVKKPSVHAPVANATQPSNATSQPVALAPTDTTPPSIPPTNPPETAPANPPAPATNEVSNLPPLPTVPPPPTSTVASMPSPLVSSVQVADPAGAFSDVIESGVPSPAFALAKNDSGFHIELWDSSNWTKKGTFTPANGAGDKYVVSPSGDLLVRLAKFPRLSAQIYSFSAGSITKTVDLTELAGATPEVLAMPTEDRLLVRWSRGSLASIEAIDIATNKHHGIDMVPFDSRPRGWAVSDFDAGRWFAVPTEVGGPQVFVYDLNGIRPIRKLPITSLDPSQYTEPTGLAFSADKRLGVLLEREGNGLLLDWDIQANRPARTHLFANGPIPGRADAHDEFSSIQWVPSLDAWLMYGQAIFDAANGKKIGELGVPNVKTARFTDANNPDTLVLTCDAPNGLRQLVKVKLNIDQIKADLEASRKNP